MSSRQIGFNSALVSDSHVDLGCLSLQRQGDFIQLMYMGRVISSLSLEEYVCNAETNGCTYGTFNSGSE